MDGRASERVKLAGHCRVALLPCAAGVVDLVVVVVVAVAARCKRARGRAGNGRASMGFGFAMPCRACIGEIGFLDESPFTLRPFDSWASRVGKRGRALLAAARGGRASGGAHG